LQNKDHVVLAFRVRVEMILARFLCPHQPL